MHETRLPCSLTRTRCRTYSPPAKSHVMPHPRECECPKTIRAEGASRSIYPSARQRFVRRRNLRNARNRVDVWLVGASPSGSRDAGRTSRPSPSHEFSDCSPNFTKAFHQSPKRRFCDVPMVRGAIGGRDSACFVFRRGVDSGKVETRGRMSKGEGAWGSFNL
ncbi:hypothetical protein BU23DRAFT_243909 [Bimuria novae-zelandiae CBS 107.79]|uniref:Uncharacterized protein n=1 Tax=Bimuria novae-zelandiae CBS 107.79 TaxID=1447943 RepID=A0A6A5UZA8_9PLEO|nr:hypothetical protein BU23DRAFT_243909 [Bimuria novae-zelandiae CBS 107.79]